MVSAGDVVASASGHDLGSSVANTQLLAPSVATACRPSADTVRVLLDRPAEQCTYGVRREPAVDVVSLTFARYGR